MHRADSESFAAILRLRAAVTHLIRMGHICYMMQAEERKKKMEEKDRQRREFIAQQRQETMQMHEKKREETEARVQVCYVVCGLA